jgi:predicted lipid-binding transport protein (Tim44 family)
MKRFLIALLVMASAMAITISEAEAKRLGGGGSAGRQSQSVTRQAPAQSSQVAKPAPPVAAPQTVPPKPASPWRGILGGALLGLGLGALLSHFGLGGAMASMLSTLLIVGLLAIAAMFIYRMFKRKNANAERPAYAGSMGSYSGSGTPDIGSHLEPRSQPAALQADTIVAGVPAKPWGVPADFDVPGFLRSAKTYYIRLQAAWDKGDVSDIREFTTTEMYAELKIELQERGAASNHTDVVTLEADLLGIEIIDNGYLASVKFSGLIKEDQNASASFSEVWNLAKPVSGPGGWVLAGIQQLA